MKKMKTNPEARATTARPVPVINPEYGNSLGLNTPIQASISIAQRNHRSIPRETFGRSLACGTFVEFLFFLGLCLRPEMSVEDPVVFLAQGLWDWVRL